MAISFFMYVYDGTEADIAKCAIVEGIFSEICFLERLRSLPFIILYEQFALSYFLFIHSLMPFIFRPIIFYDQMNFYCILKSSTVVDTEIRKNR